MAFKVKIDFFGKSDVGLVRTCNEDAFAVRPDLNICLAADGMGGAAAGELASRMFVESALKVFDTPGADEDTTECIKKAFYFANRDILDHVRENPRHKGMGCTAELLAFTEEGFVLGHMGDSRTFRLRNSTLRQLTRDHSLVQEQVDQGLISTEEARHHAMRNIVLRAIGVDQEISLDLIRGSVRPGDHFLLCSDGLTDMVAEQNIANVLLSGNSLAEKTAALIDLAKKNGGTDNITAVMAVCGPGE